MTGRAPSTPDRARPLSAATVVVGVIGDPVAHSLSPLIHNACFDALGLPWISVGFPVRAGRAPDALHGAIALGIRGLSVTMPHKEAVAAIGERTLLVEALGAANCVVAGDGGWVAHNTDGPGFVTSLRRELEFEPDDRRCLVVGAGGAARAIIAALAEAGAREVVVVNRSEWRAEQALVLAGPAGRRGVTADASGCDLVVNATPVGMDPGEDGAGSPGGRVGGVGSSGLAGRAHPPRARSGGGGPRLPSAGDALARGGGPAWRDRGQRTRHAGAPSCGAAQVVDGVRTADRGDVGSPAPPSGPDRTTVSPAPPGRVPELAPTGPIASSAGDLL
ncbi:MAG: shikimate dehydrogenase family protein [Acidimicrobiales bacterium]